jgi:hypothetical protein
MMELASSDVFALRYPDDPISLDLKRIADQLVEAPGGDTP